MHSRTRRTALQHLCCEQHCRAAAAKHCASLCTGASKSSPIYPLLNQIILCKYMKYFQSASYYTSDQWPSSSVASHPSTPCCTHLLYPQPPEGSPLGNTTQLPTFSFPSTAKC